MDRLKIINQYLEVLPCESYTLQLVHEQKEAFPPIRQKCTKDELIKRIGFLAHKNSLGYNIYCRPNSWEYVLLDDLKKEVLNDLATLKPCLLMETSPKNFQAFIHLSFKPSNREEAINICKELAHQFKADLGSAEPDHVGRLPSFTNRKKKYENEKGNFPFVILHKYENRTSNFIPKGGVWSNEISHKKRNENNEGIDRSRRDFNLVCMLLNQRKSDDYIINRLFDESEKARQRGVKYVEMTLRNAKRKLRV